jgi:hypothetical protein
MIKTRSVAGGGNPPLANPERHDRRDHRGPWSHEREKCDDQHSAIRRGGSLAEVIVNEVKGDERQQDDHRYEHERPDPASLERPGECASKSNHRGAS